MVLDPISILPFEQKHTTSVISMLTLLAKHHGHTSYLTAEFLHASCLGDSPLAQCFVAVKHACCVGFIVTYDRANLLMRQRVCEIDLLFVDQEYRRQGVGTLLIARAVADAITRGCHHTVVTAHQNNTGAQQCYKEGLGFIPHPSHSVPFYLDARSMNAFVEKHTPRP